MTLEFLEIMEDLKRKKCVKSFKSNTRVFDDDSIEVTPQEKGEPSQKDVKKVGRGGQGCLLPEGVGQADEGHSDREARTARRRVPCE